jgi:alpha-L-fucosidase
MLTLLASIALSGTGTGAGMGSTPPQAPATPVIPAETKAQKDARMAWWRKSRFGMFIHWGLYAVPAGEWNGKTNYAEWIREEAHIPVKTYDKFQQQFNPTKFNAKQWAKMAHDAGMQYLVITSKHHDGFNMFDSKYTDFKVTNTPWHKDPMKDLSKAVRAEGMKFCLYHSIMDWHYPDYLPRRSWETADRPVGNADFKKFVQYLRNDVQQIIKDYKPGVVWFDGQWEATWKEPYGSELYALCRITDPNVIVNNRVGTGRDRELGDYSTPEQTIPATGLPGVDWETCMTMNDHWGYNKADHNYKTVKTLVRDLVDIASKGGNFLLNVGPTAEGTFPPLAIDRLNGIGAWMKVNHDSIYDTTASLFDSLPFGRCTVRAEGKRTQLFFHVFDWPKDGKLVIPGLANEVKSARILGGGKVATAKSDNSVTISLPPTSPNAIDTVVQLDVVGTPVIFHAPVIETENSGFVSSTLVPISVPQGLTVRYTLDGTSVTASSPEYSKPVVVDHPLTLKVAGFYKGKAVTRTITKQFSQLELWPASDTVRPDAGLEVAEFPGDFDSVDDFLKGSAVRTSTASQVTLDPTWKVVPEHLGRTYSGTIDAPKSELYKFVLRSDDGSRLYIDGKVVVNNDGPHSSKSVEGFAPLAKGPHTILVAWFNKTGDGALGLGWSIGSSPVTSVSAASLRH